MDVCVVAAKTWLAILAHLPNKVLLVLVADVLLACGHKAFMVQ